jgi:hypothetical protein
MPNPFVFPRPRKILTARRRSCFLKPTRKGPRNSHARISRKLHGRKARLTAIVGSLATLNTEKLNGHNSFNEK